ncbi:cyclic pyranopterin monophosphate synthase subunit MoaA [Leeuwenhoekiella aestuarii]|uniref:GTP 3',8-cyclase n=1 Tax=Leeuwenhoekiella aestuarii TaxID=2249426 RepID=A0A4Q0NP63_9FLAO|nr:GTP 3',8-cyclase MoaA [Leeuwenhoekiella aestuarii]RXG11961.1 cyclic pyranopterin monophosphate synthase subunit MoaA [Leeuwenhoekiella aestuarii]RXG13519.1 cyclic pyranopterin monophosphate synthase subunit MoaA [Leeuwenhoekiella aestuarii]
MNNVTSILTDTHGRTHNYLRISLSEKCNLRCTYCMPHDGIPLSPRANLMTADEIEAFAKVFVANGVDKIRLTGGEPLVRKDFSDILRRLSNLPVRLSITTNALLTHRYIENFKRYGLNDINVSLDSLDAEKFKLITRRDQYKKAFENINQLVTEGFHVKINAVLMKDFNEDEIVDFIKLTKNQDINVRFIEFMPFDGNEWNKNKLVSEAEIINRVTNYFGIEALKPLANEQNFTARNFKIEGFKGSFGIISSVTNPFCDSCNRIRLTADGKLKNCLFSNEETNLLKAFRKGEKLEDLIDLALNNKKAVRAGMTDFNQLTNPDLHNNNRSMIAIGG